jgi:hypothetical protein
VLQSATREISFQSKLLILVMKDRSGVLLHPANWTAGVDYDEAEDPQNDDDDDNDDVPDLDYLLVRHLTDNT